MYSRSTHRSQRFYSPPPGYGGSTFTGKHHPPEQMIQGHFDESPEESVQTVSYAEREPVRKKREVSQTGEDTENAITEANRDKSTEKSPIHALLESLQGKIGEEELIILLVLLMVSSEGICAEGLILALVLLAGRSS